MKKIKKPTKRAIARQLEQAERRITKLETEACERNRKDKLAAANLSVLDKRTMEQALKLGDWVDRVKQMEEYFVEPKPEPVEVTADVAHTDEPATMSEQDN